MNRPNHLPDAATNIEKVMTFFWVSQLALYIHQVLVESGSEEFGPDPVMRSIGDGVMCCFTACSCTVVQPKSSRK